MMKQIETMCDRIYEGKPTLNKKWKAFFIELDEYGDCICFFHYQHLVAVYSLYNNDFIRTWYEKDADLRGLNDIKKYHEENKQKLSLYKEKILPAKKDKIKEVFESWTNPV